MQQFHAELNLENFDVSGWPTTGDNKVYTAITWNDAPEGKSDGVLCTLTVTLDSATDTWNCVDTYLSDKAVATSFVVDATNNVVIDKTKSSISYSTGNNGAKLLSWKAHFDRPYQSTDSSDSVLSLGESVALTAILGSYKGTVKQAESVYMTTIIVPDSSFGRLLQASASFFILAAMACINLL